MSRVLLLRVQWIRHWSSGRENGLNNELMSLLVCPLSKEQLRYDKENNELISDKVGVAYPVKNGIPHLAPEDGRLINTNQNNTNS